MVPYIDTTYSRQYYAVTISPRPQDHILKALKEDYEAMWEQLRRSSKHFCMYPEIVNKDGIDRLHYHGVINITDQTKWWKTTNKALQKIGYLRVKPIKTFQDHLRWLTYCRKGSRIHDMIGFHVSPCLPHRKVRTE